MAPILSSVLRSALASAIGLTAGTLASAAYAQSLQESLVGAYQNNPQLQSERARQRSTDEDVSRAWGGLRPNVLFSGEKGRAEDKIRYPFPTAPAPERRSPDSESVQLRQEIWDGNRTFADVEHSKMSVENGLQILISVEQSVLGAALQSYYDLYRDQNILKIQQVYLHALEEQEKATQARFRVKDVTQTDVAQAQARLARGIADAQQFQANVDTSRSAFQRVVGIVPADNLPVPPMTNAGLPVTLADAQALAEQGNPDLLATIYAEKAARADVEIAESSLLPDISIQASTNRYYHTDTNLSTNYNNTVVVALTVPLYDGGVGSAHTRAAKHTAGQRRLDIDVQRDRVRDQVNSAWQNLQASRARIKSYEENVKAAQIALTGVQQEVRVGSRTVLDELNARQELLDAQINLLRAQHDAAIAGFSLLLGCGHLTARDLNLPVDIYDPREHYEAVRWLPWSPWIGDDYPDSPKIPSR